MDANLPKDLRRAADSMLEYIQRLTPEIITVPWRIQVMYKAADDLEKQKAELDAAIIDLKEALFTDADACKFCKHAYACRGKECDCYEHGVGATNKKTGEVYPDFKWSCEDWEWGTCSKLENTPCNGCASGKHFEWRGPQKEDEP